MAPVSGSPMEQVESHIANNKVMMFSKTTCPFCVKIKQLFDSLKIKYEVLELDQIRKYPLPCENNLLGCTLLAVVRSVAFFGIKISSTFVGSGTQFWLTRLVC